MYVRASFCVSNVGKIVSSSVCGGVVVFGTADGARAWANNAVGIVWIESVIHKPTTFAESDVIRNSESANGADGISDIEGKAATGSGERAGKRASFNGADGISDIEGKAATVAASELGSERVSNLRIIQCFCRN